MLCSVEAETVVLFEAFGELISKRTIIDLQASDATPELDLVKPLMGRVLLPVNIVVARQVDQVKVGHDFDFYKAIEAIIIELARAQGQVSKAGGDGFEGDAFHERFENRAVLIENVAHT